MKRIALKIDPLLNVPLSRQLAEALRTAIIRRRLKPGDVLPTIGELADQCATSVKVPRIALEMLAKNGWTRPVRGVGSVVLDRGADARTKGRILIYVHQTGFSYYCSVMLSVLDARLLAKGYKTFVVNVGGRGNKAALRRFSAMLREKWSLIIPMGGKREVLEVAAASGHPFVLLGDGAPLPDFSSPSCVGRIEVKCGRAVPDFIRECARSRVRRVVQFKYQIGAFDVTGPLAVAGIAVETAHIEKMSSSDAVVLAALAKMRHILERNELPDLFLFTDDYVAQGGLLALALAGIRIPEDVRVVTHANKGFGPVWPRPLTRLEMDPVAHARAVADAIGDYLETSVFPPDLNLGSVWKKGRSF